MATLTVSITSGQGTTTTSKTFSAADSQRIFTAYQNKVNPSGTQQNLTDFVTTFITNYMIQITQSNETVIPAPPVFS